MAIPLIVPARRETWYLLERLGQGGEAETWRARRVGRLLTDEVCLKLPLRLPDADERRALLEEARVLSSVRHPNVVSLLDVVEDELERPVIVLELVDGIDLRRAQLQRSASTHGLAPASVASVGRLLALALAAAGRAVPGGMVHRDVTPHNVLISGDGEVKLADFGIVRALRREAWTKSGHVKGKCAYVAPEQIRGERYDARSDVFSLGVVLFELLAGRRPFGGTGLFSQLDAIASDRRERLTERASALPPGLAEIIDAMLAHAPSERPDPLGVARALAPFADEQRRVDELQALVRSTRGPGLASTRPGRRRVASR